MAALVGQRTFLQLQSAIAERLLEQTALSTSTYPTLARVKEEINNVYKQLYGKRPWKWALKSTTIPTVAGTTNYALADDVVEVYEMQIRAQGLSVAYIPREVFMSYRPYGWTNISNSVPTFAVSAAPASNNALSVDLWPTPDAIYTINYDYRARFTALSADADYPVFPPEQDDLLVQGPLVQLYQMLGDDRWKGAQERYNELYRELWMQDERELNFMNSQRELGGQGAYPGLPHPYIQ